MKKIIILLISFLSLNELYSSQLIFKPVEPQQGDTVVVEYKNNPRFEKFKELDLLIYQFSESSSFPIGSEVKLTKNKDKFLGKFVVPNQSVFLLFKIFAVGEYSDNIDNNLGKYWELLIYKDRRPVRNTYLKAALARLGSISSNIDRIPDFYEAIEMLENELNYYPDNLSAELGLTTTLYDMKKINQEEFSKRIKIIAYSNINILNEIEVKSKARALTAINETESAEKILQTFAGQFPKSEIAEEQLITQISNADNFNDFDKFCKVFFKSFPNSINKERIYTAFTTAYMQMNKLNELITFIDSSKSAPAFLYARIAKNLFEFYSSKSQQNQPSNKELVLNLVEKSESKISQLKNEKDIEHKPKIYTNGEWLDLIDIEQASVLEIKADILKTYEPVNAVPLYKESIMLYRNYATEQIYENLIDLLIILGDSSKAMLEAENAIIKGKGSEKILDNYQELRKNLTFTNDSTFALILDSLNIVNAEFNKEQLLNEVLESAQISYSLESLEGTYIDQKDLKNKIVIFNFFSSWCSPCQSMFPALEDLYNIYLNDSNVEFVSVNSLENNKFNKDDLKKFVIQNDVKFPVVRDVMDLIPRQLGVIGLPTIAIIDKESKLRFLIKGFSNNNKLISDVIEKVNFLINERK